MPFRTRTGVGVQLRVIADESEPNPSPPTDGCRRTQTIRRELTRLAPCIEPVRTDLRDLNTSEEVIAAALDQVGDRLRTIRNERGLTLTTAANTTGISKSTLSRLENGERRPSLELLLPLAQAYRVPLDDLVGAPEVGDPRIRLVPKRINGRTVVPLTQHAGGMQAWKIVIPVTKHVPELRVHEGYEWLYVIAGKMRLILGNHDLILGPGEVAEFDTKEPHWFGSNGQEPAEVLSLFGRHGERMQHRAQAYADATDQTD